MPRPVPNDVEPLLRQYGGYLENLALYLHKGVKPNPDDGDFPSKDLPSKFPPLERLRGTSDLPDLVRRMQEEYDSLIASHPTLTTYRMRRHVDWRMVVGLGRASVRETNITLHHVYGLPYVPGSSVKGCVRSYVLLQAFWTENLMESDGDEAGNELEGRGLRDPLFCQLFGCPEKIDKERKSYYEEARRGRMRFFDAYPTEVPLVERDILNPHYRDYYMDKKPPTDDQDPTPIYFLTLRETGFSFWLGEDTGTPSPTDIVGAAASPLYEATPETHRESLLDVAVYWLNRTLTEYGLGAKTATGYGYFSPPTSEDEEGDGIVEASASVEEANEGGLPEGIEPLAAVDANTKRIPAKVVDNDSNPIKVRVYVDGYEEKTLSCQGIYDPSKYPTGTFLYVESGMYRREKLYNVHFDRDMPQ